MELNRAEKASKAAFNLDRKLGCPICRLMCGKFTLSSIVYRLHFAKPKTLLEFLIASFHTQNAIAA